MTNHLDEETHLSAEIVKFKYAYAYIERNDFSAPISFHIAFEEQEMFHRQFS